MLSLKGGGTWGEKKDEEKLECVKKYIAKKDKNRDRHNIG